MSKYESYFNFELNRVNFQHFYLYLIISALVAGFLVLKSQSKYKVEMFFLSFYLLSGNLNTLLIFKIPGVSFFEIQPVRFIYLMLLFLIIRKTWYSTGKSKASFDRKVAWFEIALFGYVFFLSLSALVNIAVNEALKTILDAVAFIIIMFGLRKIEDQPSYNIIGKSMIITGVFTSIISLIQLVNNPYFMRIGDNRRAFGSLIRSNGIFSAEYLNSYYLIIAIVWVLTTIKNKMLRTGLVVLFSAGVATSFMRMSWLLLILILLVYFIVVNRTAIEKLLFAAGTCIAVILVIFTIYSNDIMKSSLVQDRLNDSVDYRKGYYTMVLDNIHKRPFLGFGDLKNEVYYENLLLITKDRDRATAASGSLHSGYFSSLFRYGIPALLCFTLFTTLSVKYYSTYFGKNLYYMIPFAVSVIFMIGNMTNSFLFISYLSVLYAIHIGIGMGTKEIDEQSLIYTKSKTKVLSARPNESL